jgi:hypothetical protein
VKKPKATWVEPVIEAELAYSTVTENALLRSGVQGPARASGRAGGAHPRRQNFAGRKPTGMVAAMRNLAGRRFAATSLYQPEAPLRAI